MLFEIPIIFSFDVELSVCFQQMVVTKDAEQVIKDIKQAKKEDFVCHTGKILDGKTKKTNKLFFNEKFNFSSV